MAHHLVVFAGEPELPELFPRLLGGGRRSLVRGGLRLLAGGHLVEVVVLGSIWIFPAAVVVAAAA